MPDDSLRGLIASIADLDPEIKAEIGRIDVAANPEIQRLATADQASTVDPFVQGVKRFGSTFASDLGHAALGLGQLLTTRPDVAAANAGAQLAADYAAGGARGAGVSAAEGVTGLPLRQIGTDYQQGRYPELAGHLAAGGLMALLAHKGLRAPEAGVEAPTGAGRVWDVSARPEAFGPEVPPPSTEPYVGPRQQPLKSMLGLDPQSFEAPARGAGNVTGNLPEATPRFPTMSDEAARPLPAEGYDQFMPNTSAGPAEPAPSARYAFHQDDFEGGSFPMYHIEGGPADGSTVSAATLSEQGIPVPKTPEPPSAAPAKFRITADEFSNILKGREKFAQKNPEVDLPPGARDEMDRMGLEYGRTQSELKRLLGLDAPTPEEAADLSRYQQAARELGSRLRSAGKTISTPPDSAPPAPTAPASIGDMLRASLADQVNTPARDAHFKLPETNVDDAAFARAADTVRKRNPNYRADERLVERRATPRPGGGDVLPATAVDLGPEYAPASENPLTAFLKNEEGSYNTQALKDAFSPENRQKIGALAQAQQAGALLFSPLTIGRIGVSNTFAALLKAAEHAAAEHSMAPIGRIGKELTNFKQLGRDAIDAFQNPDELHSKLDPGTQARGLFGVASRAVGAVDRPFRNAMERAGFSPEDALSVTQQRTPVTALGKHLLSAQQGHAFTRFAIPFAKSGINLLEQGLIEPAQSAARIALMEGTPADAVKVSAATGAAAAGYYGSKKLDESNAPNWLKRLALATTGQYEVPAAIAQAAGEAPTLRKFGEQAARNLPVIGPGVDLSPTGLLHRAIPRALNPDFYTGTERDTTDPRTGKQSELRQLQAEIPGLAQLLRVKRKTRPARHP